MRIDLPVSGKLRSGRALETFLLLLAVFVAVLGFVSTAAAEQIRQGQPPWPAIPDALLPPFVFALAFFTLHILLSIRRAEIDQIILPVTALLVALGLVMIFRLRGAEGAWQQILRGLLPGCLAAGFLIVRSEWIERLRRWAIPISLVGMALPIATALFGVVDETGTRLALKLGPLPPIQTSEIIKVALIVFLAWYVEREGRAAEGRAAPWLGWLRLPAIRYLIPGVLFVVMASLALVQMSDYGAVLILAFIFVGMLYAGFETRIFGAITVLGLMLALVVGFVLANVWEIPTTIRYRFLAFRDPWSQEMVTLAGQPLGITISQGPGYQIQQSIYSAIAGGLTGRGLGFGSPEYVPLAHSDFIYIAILEELGTVIGFAVLALFAILLLRILRVAVLLPSGQIFERLLLTGIAIHLFIQVFVMTGGALNLIPMTGVTVPFLSQGGVALLVNFVEIGIVLTLAHRLEFRRS
ncbi:MAG: FtsW/RodA/SpoVE family cell cycle protein [Anaerolineales bacterium]